MIDIKTPACLIQILKEKKEDANPTPSYILTPVAYSPDYQMSEWLDSKTIANHPEKKDLLKGGESRKWEKRKLQEEMFS